VSPVRRREGIGAANSCSVTGAKAVASIFVVLGLVSRHSRRRDMTRAGLQGNDGSVMVCKSV
jgi:hypothetical protein